MNDFQGQIDNLAKKFQVVVAKTDDWQAQIANDRSEFQKFISLFNEMKDSHASLVQIVEYLSKQCTESFKKASRSIEGHDNSLLSIVESISRSGFDLTSLRNELKSFEGKMSSISTQLEKTAHVSMITDIKEVVKGFSEEVKNNFQNNLQTTSGILNDVTLCKNFINSMKVDAIELKKKIEDHVSSVDQVNSNFKSLKDSVLASVAEANRYVDTQIRNGISSIPKPVIPSLDDAAKQFQTKLEPVTLDAQNAKLRSSNNEAKILILEKKVEQLQLLVNKLQLQG